jgi:hypothetical protein
LEVNGNYTGNTLVGGSGQIILEDNGTSGGNTLIGGTGGL